MVLVSHTPTQTLIKPKALFPHQAFPPGSLSTFIDSGADANTMDEGFVLQLGIGQILLSCTITVKALVSHLLGTF